MRQEASGEYMTHLTEFIPDIKHICGWVKKKWQRSFMPGPFPRGYRLRSDIRDGSIFQFYPKRFTSQKVMTISSRDFSRFRCRIDLTLCIGNPIGNGVFWKSWCCIFNRIPYTNQQINPTSKKRKFSTWNRHNFLTSEPILIKLKIKSIANISSE